MRFINNLYVYVYKVNLADTSWQRGESEHKKMLGRKAGKENGG